LKILRDYQRNIASSCADTVKKLGIAYLAMEVRTGKTATALEAALQLKAKNVLFLTKKKAIQSIENDYIDFGYKIFFELTVANDESLHKVVGYFDLVIHDEHHRFGAFPKPSQGAKLFKEKFSKVPMIFLSGTPTPESYSQIFHQFWVSQHTPFEYKNFYQWAKEFVNVKDKHLGYAVVKDYSQANKRMIDTIIEPYMITFTQQQAGFTTSIKETVLYCNIEDKTHRLIKKLQQDKVIEGKDEVILADTGVKLMTKCHQMYSGTVKFESGNSKVIDLSKAKFIKEHFKDSKIAIFYKFKAELTALKEVFGDNLCEDLKTFNTTTKNIALQIVSGREGISLKEADYLIFYNIDFSAVSYFQAIDRLTTMERKSNEVFWIFATNGIEEKIYNTVKGKKDYTTNYFLKDYGVKIQSKSYQRI
jgi:hypothetical protein